MADTFEEITLWWQCLSPERQAAILKDFQIARHRDEIIAALYPANHPMPLVWLANQRTLGRLKE